MKRLTVASAATFVLAALTLALLRPLTPIDETGYLAVAQEMFSGGSKLVLHLNGEIYGDMPPLLFWMIEELIWF